MKSEIVKKKASLIMILLKKGGVRLVFDDFVALILPAPVLVLTAWLIYHYCKLASSRFCAPGYLNEYLLYIWPIPNLLRARISIGARRAS